ncbi:MAG: flippase-like domain-containing protein [Anaerolineae bacterium]|nr:flippase-like domain-containing protein [Anaerolineae bacterium]MCB0235640.1 flippase-like domain-containing protein [Anaerolineae bacterium]MCB0248417.1 flippase-like domain-containing protein [Anaerolineae bacterium]MCB9133494.1 flippase-like domain-containing protein [Anaerolineales bacterium]MCO5244954.1 flippase-like domain-containing protein [Anaerolineae bacterium]
METRQSKSQRLLVGVVLVLTLLGLTVIALDWKEIRQVVVAANWKLVPVALLFTALSYTCMSYAFAVSNRLFSVKMALHELAKIGFVSQVLNHLLSSGGAAGYSMRFLTMGRQGVRTQDILAASFFHFYVTSLGMLSLLPAGVAYVLLRHPLSGSMTRALGFGMVLMVAIFLLGTLTVFVRPVRTAVIHLVARAGRTVARRDINEPLAEFNDTISRGVDGARRRPARFLALLALVSADWIFSLIAMAFCFNALGDPIKAGVLVTGYTFGVLAGVLSMIPGGLGVQEGSMAGIYALLGVPFQQAVLAAVLFRIVYYFVPYLVSLAFYRRMLRQLPAPETAGAIEP